MPSVFDLVQATNDPRTPGGERFDQNAELWNQFVGGLDFPPQDQLNEGIQYLLTNEEIVKGGPLAGDGMLSLNAQFYQTRTKAKVGNRISVLEVNEYGLVGGVGAQSRWRERPTAGFDFIKSMVSALDIVKAILLTRQRQMVPFLRWKRDRDQGPIGCRIVRADGEKLSDKDKPRVKRIENWLDNCGDVAARPEREKLQRSTLQNFVRKLIWDTLSADACPIELATTIGGKLSGIYNVPFDTVRLCTEEGYEGDDEIRAVQVIDSIPYATYTYKDLIYRIRNPRSEIWTGGYGFAEPEMCVRAMTAYLNAVTYNASGIDRNAIPRGILTLFGDYGQRQLEGFKRNMKAMLTGGQNRWQIPIMASKSEHAAANWTPIDLNFNEMYFARWMTFLVSITCAIYGIDPNEIHFDSFTVHRSALAGSDTAEKIALSRDKGFVPLVYFVQDVLCEIVCLLDKTYTFEFVGLDEEDKAQEHERMKLSQTINEIREQDGKDPHEDPDLGNAPGNPALMQVYMMKLQQRIQQEMQEQQGAGDGFGGPADDYNQDGGGEHNPYGMDQDGPPQDEHMHTLAFDEEDDQGAPPLPKAQKAPRPKPKATSKPPTIEKAAPTDGRPFVARVDRDGAYPW